MKFTDSKGCDRARAGSKGAGRDIPTRMVIREVGTEAFLETSLSLAHTQPNRGAQATSPRVSRQPR